MADRQKAIAQLTATRRKAETLAHALSGRWTSMETRAIEFAKDREPGRGSFFGRGATTWTQRQERWYQATLAIHIAEEERSLRAMLARYDRLCAAAAEQARRLRLNEERTWMIDSWDTGRLYQLRAALSETV